MFAELVLLLTIPICILMFGFFNGLKIAAIFCAIFALAYYGDAIFKTLTETFKRKESCNNE